MSSNSETGHARNVANIKQLAEYVATLGSQYNPSNSNISHTALSTKWTASNSALVNHRNAKAQFDTVVNQREIQFKDVRKLATRIVSALNACGASDEVVKDARSILLKIRGERAKPKKKPAQVENPDQEGELSPPQEGEGQGSKDETKQISVSQQSYDQITENFAKLLALVQLEPKYMPNEPDLTVASLTTYADNLLASNGAVASQVAAYTTSLHNRNKILYEGEESIPKLAEDVKEYMKSVFGSNSPEYKTVRSIKFKSR